ncbi:MAG: hypothetical protein QXP42_03690 [Candidatus Micrarchaeia archaeon]
MRLAIATLFLVLLFSESYAINNSFSSIEKLPIDFNAFWSDDTLVFPGTMEDMVAKLYIDNVNITERSDLNLTPSDEKNFQKSLTYMENAQTKIYAARIAKGRAEQFRSLSIALILLHPLPMSPLIISSAEVYYLVSIPNYKSTLDNARDALISSDASINSALERIAEAVATLEYAGAGYEGYTGKSSGTYSMLMEILAKSGEKNISEKNDFASLYSKTLYLTKDIREKFANGSFDFSDTYAYSKAINNSIGPNGLLNMSIVIDKEVRAAYHDMIAEYEELLFWAEMNESDALDAIKRAEDRGYSLIDAKMVFAFASNETIFRAPSERLVVAKDLLLRRGLEKGSHELIRDAKSVYGSKKRWHIGQAIVLLREALSKTNRAYVELLLAEEDVRLLIQNSEQLVNAEKQSTEEKINSFVPKNYEEAAALNQSRKFYEEGVRLCEEAEEKSYTNEGRTLQLRFKALLMFGNASLLLSEKSLREAKMTLNARDALHQLKETIEKAKRDELDVSYEENYLQEASALLDFADEEILLQIAQNAEKLIGQIYERAHSKYNLTEKRNYLLEFTEYMSESERDKFLFCERFVVGEDFPPESTLGHYAEIDRIYTNIILSIEKRKPDIIAENIEFTFSKHFDETLLLDENTKVTIELLLRNPLPFASSSVLLDIPLSQGYELLGADIYTKPAQIKDIAITASRITIKADIEAKGYYRIVFKTKQKIAQTTGRKTSQHISKDELIVQESIKIHSKSEAPLLTAILNLPSTPSSHRVFFNGIECDAYVKDNNLVVRARGLKEGENQLFVETAYPNPFSISRNCTLDSTTLCTIRVLSRDIELSSVPIVLIEPGTISDIRVVNLKTGERPEDLSTTKIGDAWIVRWTIGKLIPRAVEEYLLSYKVHNETSLIETMLNQSLLMNQSVENISNMGISSEALNALYALREMEATPQQPSQTFLSQSELLNRTREKAFETARTLDSLGMDENARDIEKLINLSYDYERRALENFSTTELYRALEILENTTLCEIAISQRDTLLNETAERKREALLLSQLADTTELVSDISNIETKIAAAGRYISESDCATALVQLNMSRGMLNQTETSINSRASDIYRHFENMSLSFQNLKQSLAYNENLFNNAMRITVDKNLVKDSGVNLSGFTFPDVSSQLRHLSNTFENLFENSKNRSKFVIENARNLRIAEEEYGEVVSARASLINSLRELNEKANISLAFASSQLKKLKEVAPRNAQYSDEINSLQAILEQSESAKKEGRLADSILLSSYVSKRVTFVISRIPKEENNLLPIVLISIALLVIVSFVMLRKPKKPPEPKVIPMNPPQRNDY